MGGGGGGGGGARTRNGSQKWFHRDHGSHWHRPGAISDDIEVDVEVEIDVEFGVTGSVFSGMNENRISDGFIGTTGSIGIDRVR